MAHWSAAERASFVHAALSGRFRPAGALPPDVHGDALRAAETASALADLCDIDADGCWVMRTRSRHWVLERLQREGGLAAAVAARRAAHTNAPEVSDLLAAIEGAPPFDADGRAQLIAAADAVIDGAAPADRARLEALRQMLGRMVAAIEHAGPAAHAPGGPLDRGATFRELARFQTRMSCLEKMDRQQAMTDEALFGRAEEREAILDWLSVAEAGTIRAVHLCGLPGAGKSVLLEHVAAARLQAGDLVVRLDFDRAGLDILDLDRLTMEVARQLGDTLRDDGIALLLARQEAAKLQPGDERLGSAGVRQIPVALARAIGAAIQAAARGGPERLLFVLDTLEVLRARGSHHPDQLFDWLIALAGAARAECPALRIAAVAAERGPLPDGAVAKRQGLRLLPLAVPPLPDADALLLLRAAGSPPAGDALALALAAGSPLILRLAAQALTDGADPTTGQAAVAEAIVYRYLVSRFDDPLLKRLAAPALLLADIDADTLAHRVAPADGLPPLDAAEAGRLMGLLESQHWLVEPVPDRPGWLRRRCEPGLVLQRLLPLAHPAMAAQLLPGGSAGSAPAAHPEPPDSAAAAPDPGAAAGLPDLGRPEPTEVPPGGWAERLVTLLDREDWVEGERVALAWQNAPGARDPLGEDAAAATAFRWRAGRWADAEPLMRSRLEADPAGRSLHALPLSIRAAFLEIWAAFAPEALAAALGAEPLRLAATTPRQDQAQLARSGSLGFRLHAEGFPPLPDNGRANPVRATLALQGLATDDEAVAHAFRIARQRLAARGGAAKRLGWNDRQLLASLSPYPLFAARLLLQREYAAIADHADRTHEALVQAGGLFLPPLEGLRTDNVKPLAGIADMGLFAEWLGAAWFWTQDPHLQAMAAVAERTGDGRTVATPWPLVEAGLAAGLAEPSDAPPEPGELRYQHFGVKYSADLKLPIVTAVNIDGARSQRIKRGRDRWFTDGRLTRDVQLGAGNFRDPEIDRGHMVRREDPNWGMPEAAERADFDTFHYPNAAAQHGLMNRGKQLWQGLENYILESGRTHGFRLCVFTGPVVGEADEAIDGARVPEEYWKLVATLDAEDQALRATAYLLSQGQMIRALLEKRRRTEAVEGLRLGPYRTFQIAVADLGEATGHDFGAYAAADPLSHPATESLATAAPRFLALETLAAIRL